MLSVAEHIDMSMRHLARMIAGRRNDLVGAVSSGNCADIAQYREQCGRIAELDVVSALMEEAEKRTYGDPSKKEQA